jgi:hypothetical protein
MSQLARVAAVTTIWLAIAQTVGGQSIQLPWSGFAHTPQHGCVSTVPSQPLNRILWTMPLAQGDRSEFTHYTGPVVTRSNTVIFPISLTNGSFQIEALAGATGQTNWEQPTDYSGTAPFCALTLTPGNRLYFAGDGGTVFYCDSPDTTATPSFTRTAFYGLDVYLMKSNMFNAYIQINTPITPDRYGDIFFGFQSAAPTLLGTRGGLARIDYNGTGSWISASEIGDSTNVFQSALNCAPALSLDQKTVYVTVEDVSGALFLAALDSRTLEPLTSVSLIDPETKAAASISDSTASPTIGPNGDVYYGVLGNPSSDNDYRGWLLHFDSSLSVAKIPGLFGWDVTDSIVNASLVPSYGGNSTYLLATKYNNYRKLKYSMAILDPQQGVLDSQSGVTVMTTVLTIPSPSPLEWCVNSAAVDPFSKSIIANNEDGNLYRWDLTSNQLTQSVALTTTQSGQAYTPTVVGVDGTVYAINHGQLFAVGK